MANIHSRTLKSRHYSTTIISFYLSEESSQTHRGSSETLKCSPLTAKEGWDCIIDLYHLAMQQLNLRHLQKQFRSHFRQIIEEQLFNSSEASGEKLLSGLLSGVRKPWQCCLLQLKIIVKHYLQAKLHSPSSLQ